MKNVFRLLTIAALAVTFALPSLAQEAAAAQADDPAKTALYEKFVKERGDKSPASQAAAYQTGKEYLAKYGAPEDQYNTYVRGWVGKYEVALREFELNTALNNDPSKAFQLARGVLANEPDNLGLHIRLVAAGLANASKNESLNGETLNYAKRALQLAEQGKTVDQWTPFRNRDEALGWLNYAVGANLVKNSPEEAVPYLIKAAQANSPSKTEPTTYSALAVAYYNGEFKRLAAEYKAKYEGQPETPEGVALYERVNQSLDRVIDAYARAHVYNTDAALKKEMLDRLTTVYKTRHENSDAGLQEYIAGVTNRPLPLPGQPVTPTTTPTSTGATPTPPAANSTPATTTGGSTATTTTNTNGAKPSTPTPKP
ncbi:MAG TPA: hypothetical protein VFS10_17420 [Pyrinomonadaceae bacterium]|nr:hypothetical protein [Pyrinomonadaceae bacterium]